jgi:hypothetical protein
MPLQDWQSLLINVMPTVIAVTVLNASVDPDRLRMEIELAAAVPISDVDRGDYDTLDAALSGLALPAVTRWQLA